MAVLATSKPLFSVMAFDTVTIGTYGMLGRIHKSVDELAIVGEVMLFGESVLTIVHPAGTRELLRSPQLREEGHSKTPVDEAPLSQF